MDNAHVKSNSIIAAGAIVLQNSIIESGGIYAGVPAKKIKEISEAQFAELIERIANNYVMYAGWYQ